MAKPKKIKVVISENLKHFLEKVDNELRDRGAKDYNLCEILEKLIISSSAKKIIDDFVNENTPESYKLSKLLNTPGEREKILELLQDKSFGLTGSNATENQAQV